MINGVAYHHLILTRHFGWQAALMNQIQQYIDMTIFKLNHDLYGLCGDVEDDITFLKQLGLNITKTQDNNYTFSSGYISLKDVSQLTNVLENTGYNILLGLNSENEMVMTLKMRERHSEIQRRKNKKPIAH